MYRLHSLMLINRIVGITCNKEAQRIALSFITAVSYQISLIMFPTSLLHVVKMSTIFFLICVYFESPCNSSVCMHPAQ